MREIIEFRIPEEYAARYLSPKEGISLGGSVRKYELASSDARFSQLGRLDRELKAQGHAFFTSWTQRRRYSKSELDAAKIFLLRVRSVFEPAGEERGTKYDESNACSRVFVPEMQMEICGHMAKMPATTCGVGAVQLTNLFLDWKRIPKGKDISKTIAGEIVVSARLVELFRSHGITGAEFRAIRHSPALNVESRDWFQLVVPSVTAEIAPPTRVGIDPFHDDAQGEFRCPLGHVIGLNLLSEVSVKSATRDNADIASTRQFIGARRGLLRPERILLASPKLRRLIQSEKLKGFEAEVAHLV